jgi:Tol biopolymer transport system component
MARPSRVFGSGAAVIAVGVVSVAFPAPAAAAGFHTDRVSVATGGAQANDRSLSSAISADGRFVAFDSPASNLVAGDTNGVDDLFLRDRRTHTTKRISTSYTGGQSDGQSSNPSISHDGRYVAFSSTSSDLVSGDTNGFTDTFVRDTWTGRTERVSVSSTGGQGDGDNYGSSISADGRYVVFDSYAANLVPDTQAGNVLIHDRQTGSTKLVSSSYQGGSSTTDGGSYWGTVSGSGRYVAFVSWESTIVPGDTNNVLDVFVRDLTAGTTIRASIASSGEQAVERSGSPVVSDDGHYAAFTSEDPTLVTGDTNGGGDLFLRDLWAGTTRRVSESRTGEAGNSTSSDGQLTPDGRYIVFNSGASNLVPDDTNEAWDVFVQDLRTHRSTLVSRSSGGAQGDLDSTNGRITPDARHVVYDSYATNLVSGDTNGELDVFVTDLGTSQ